MGFLNRFFGSADAIAKGAEHDKALILISLKDYLNGLPEKEQIISQLPYQFGQRKTPIQRLKQLLGQEFTELVTINKGEKHLFHDVKSLEHSKLSKRISRLRWFLAHAETEYRDIYRLLHELYLTLRSESELVEKIITAADLRKFRKLVDKLKSEIAVEKDLVNRLIAIKDFYNIVSNLARGEYIIHNMDLKEKRLLKTMQSRMQNIFSKELTQDITYEWAITVFNAVQDIVMDHEAIIARGFDPHPNVDFEFVNRPEFVDLVRETIQVLRNRKELNLKTGAVFEPAHKNISEQMINVFVHLFKEWYNHERD